MSRRRETESMTMRVTGVEEEKISLRGVQELEESQVVELSGRRVVLEVRESQQSWMTKRGQGR